MNNQMYRELDDLKEIRKHYGEKMFHLCRDLFPTILETKGLLYHIIETHFARSKQLCEDIMSENKEVSFKTYIYSIYDEITNKSSRKEVNKSVRELLKEKGYTLYECKTNEDVQRFRKYYRKDEELCTFRDSHRINNYNIFFIVKDNADELKREDFRNPKREDEYSVSVLDLQFDKGERQRVSIKSRYNHTVSNPDATYSNNLENIAEGLTEAFEKEYGFNIGNEYRDDFELDNYTLASDNKFYKYNYEINNVHYCPNNVIIDNGKIVDTYKDQGRYILIDYFIIDRKEKEITLYDKRIKDSFVDGLTDITDIEVTKEEGCKKIVIHQGEKASTIKIDNNGRIISYENKSLTSCGDNFLYWNNSLQELSLPNLQSCGDEFLFYNESLQELNLPKLQHCKDYFFCHNDSTQEVYLPNLQSCGDDFLYCNESLQELNLPELQSCKDYFLCHNDSIQEVCLPELQSCGNDFLYYNKSLQKLNLPNLESCGQGFLYWNEYIQALDLPNLKFCGGHFFYHNNSIQEVYLPNLQSCGSCFFYHNDSLRNLRLTNLQSCGNSFLWCNRSLQELNLPELQSCGNEFLYWNKSLKELALPNLKTCGDRTLCYHPMRDEILGQLKDSSKKH